MNTKTLMSAAEYLNICDQWGSSELVHGEVVRLSPGSFRHSDIAAKATFFLMQWSRETKLGRVLACEAGIKVDSDPDTVRGADVAYLSYQRLPRGAEPSGFLTTPPDLVVEVIGKGHGWREMVENAAEYLHMGVDRVWVIDPASRRVHVFRPDAEPTCFQETDVLHDAAVLPQFSCPVAHFFAD